MLLNRGGDFPAECPPGGLIAAARLEHGRDIEGDAEGIGVEDVVGAVAVARAQIQEPRELVIETDIPASIAR